MNLADFETMVTNHDLTYSYSDDGEVYRRGQRRYDEIRKAAETLPREDVERIWNAVVDTKVIEAVRSQFYWRWPDRAVATSAAHGEPAA
jgi:hypothetical protein